MTHSNHPQWIQAQEDLKESMKQEIKLMREILSNMIQEETFLLIQDKASWEGLMQSRFQLVEQVKIFRKSRMHATQRIVSLSDEKTLDSFLSEGQESTCEITLLLDQLIALSNKINSQNVRNQQIMKNAQHFVAIPHKIGYPPHVLPTEKGRKHFLMTIP